MSVEPTRDELAELVKILKRELDIALLAMLDARNELAAIKGGR